jgi:pilus assembly protein CpaB
LVGVEDDTVAQANEVDQNSLLGLTKTTAKRAIKKEICTIRTRRGSDVVEIPSPCTN